MKRTKIIMGMPITIEIVDNLPIDVFNDIFAYFRSVDNRFSTYKKDSEISQVNNNLPKNQWSSEMKTVMRLCEQTRAETNGYFNITHKGIIDPSGLVKGWAIQNAAKQLLKQNSKNFYIEAGGDIQVHGINTDNNPWLIGIRNPFNIKEVIKTIVVSSEGVATSGTYIRGQHIYNPLAPRISIIGVRSLTVVGPNIYEADRFATAAFAMGERGIGFIESLKGFEGYMIDSSKIATFTSGFDRYVDHRA